jgi:hypothetical protein
MPRRVDLFLIEKVELIKDDKDEKTNGDILLVK